MSNFVFFALLIGQQSSGQKAKRLFHMFQNSLVTLRPLSGCRRKRLQKASIHPKIGRWACCLVRWRPCRINSVLSVWKKLPAAALPQQSPFPPMPCWSACALSKARGAFEAYWPPRTVCQIKPLGAPVARLPFSRHRWASGVRILSGIDRPTMLRGHRSITVAK